MKKKGVVIILEWVKAISLCEAGARDGLQNESVLLTVEQKVQLISGMIEAGFKVIEAGSFVRPKSVPQMADTDEVFRRLKQNGQPPVDAER